MAEPTKKFSVQLSLARYDRFNEIGREMGYSDIQLGDILISYALPDWDAAIKQRIREVKSREQGQPGGATRQQPDE